MQKSSDKTSFADNESNMDCSGNAGPTRMARARFEFAGVEKSFFSDACAKALRYILIEVAPSSDSQVYADIPLTSQEFA